MKISPNPIVEVRNLVVHYPVRTGFFKMQYLKAVDDISFNVKSGETLGIVGESGCGKTTTAKSVLRLEKNTSGNIYFKGEDITNISNKYLRAIKRDMQIVFQDPYFSLDPRMRIGDIIGEPLIVHKLCKKQSQIYKARIAELLTMVGLEESFANRFPHEFSGGQRQRIGIARAIATEPDLIICDEPVSALDVSIQSQIITLLRNLQNQLNLTYIFISHDIAIVRNISTKILVMYLGKIVEIISSEDLYLKSEHPYTQAIISAVLIPDPEIESTRDIIKISGDMPSPLSPPKGCRFSTRCYKATDICNEQCPELKKIGDNHWVACHLL